MLPRSKGFNVAQKYRTPAQRAACRGSHTPTRSGLQTPTRSLIGPVTLSYDLGVLVLNRLLEFMVVVPFIVKANVVYTYTIFNIAV